MQVIEFKTREDKEKDQKADVLKKYRKWLINKVKESREKNTDEKAGLIEAQLQLDAMLLEAEE